ncbi:MAG: cytochrome c oxidase accessory protein CcoG [Burkholderiales bacterium]|nr:cytochrome c oxidase accessory protein CcoG [Burkholderiales bacterium]
MSKPLKVIPLTLVPAGADETLESVRLYADHKKIYPRWVSGVFTRWRIFFVFATQLFFYGIPWLQVRGEQALLFDVAHQRFYVFGIIFLPQDFIYLTALLVLCAVGLFAWTTIGGRLWCGFSCPQTVYTEIFLWIEQWVEGDRLARMRLDRSPTTAHKLRLKAAKHALWLVFSLWTGFTFVGYFTPMHALWQHAVSLTLGGYTLFWVLFYAFATYGNAGWLREQVCKYMCPYARFQSAMFDADTLVVSYDRERGEPRGGRGRAVDYQSEGKGACIDCKLCVQVCPVGIDIREGLQYECIGCAVCIDACDSIMDKMRYPRGLIRFTTENALTHTYPETDFRRRLLRPRVLVYAAILSAVFGVTAFALWQRQPLRVNIAHERIALVRETADGLLENSYWLQIENADHVDHTYRIATEGLPGAQVLVDGEPAIKVRASADQGVAVRVRVDPAQAGPGSHRLRFIVTAQDAPCIHTEEKSSFFGR